MLFERVLKKRLSILEPTIDVVSDRFACDMHIRLTSFRLCSNFIEADNEKLMHKKLSDEAVKVTLVDRSLSSTPVSVSAWRATDDYGRFARPRVQHDHS